VEELLDFCVEVIRVANPERTDGSGVIDEDVRRHAADAEQLRVFARLVEEDRPLEAPEVAVVLHPPPGVASLPDVDQDHVQTGPVCLPAAQLLKQRRLRVTGSSPTGKEVEDVLPLRPLGARAHRPGSQVWKAERRQLPANQLVLRLL
jgi:hypothetical protein